MAAPLLLCLSLLSIAASVPVPQTNPITNQPVIDFTFTTQPPADVNAFTFTMPGNTDPNQSTISPVVGNGPLQMDPTVFSTVEPPVDPSNTMMTAYYSPDAGTMQPADDATEAVQNMDNAILIQGTTIQTLQDPDQTTFQQVDVDQQSDGTTTLGVPVVLYDAPQGATGMDDPAGTATVQSLQDTTTVQMDSDATTTIAPLVVLNASAVPAVDLSDPSATPGPAIILNDTVFSFDPTTPDYADYDSTGAVNAVQRDTPSGPVVLDDLAPGSTSVQPPMDPAPLDPSATVVVPVSTTVAPLVDDEVAPLVNVQPVQAQPVDYSDTVTDGMVMMDTTVVPIGVQQQDSSAPVLVPNPILADPVTSAPAAVEQQTLTMVNVQQQGANTAYQVINMTETLAQNLLLNISMPSSPDSLLQRLNYSTNTMDYTGKLDVALQLTAMAHNLMSAVDSDLDDLAKQ